jgi:hypothetical protein
MRPARIIATVALAAAVAGCSASGNRTSAPPASTAIPVATAPTSAGTPSNSEPAVLADGRHPALLKSVDPGRSAITFDVIQFYQGDDATREAAKDHQESPPPNDLYIRNVSPRLRTLPLRADTTITVNGLLSTQENTPVSLAKLATLTRTYSPVFWITVRHDQVVKIAEQWTP